MVPMHAIPKLDTTSATECFNTWTVRHSRLFEKLIHSKIYQNRMDKSKKDGSVCLLINPFQEPWTE